MLSYCLIDTTFGPIGLMWSASGLVRVQLPGSDRAKTTELLLRGREASAGDPPEWLQPTLERLVRYFDGEAVVLSDAALDFSAVPPFNQALYGEMLKLGWGETVTYGELGARAGFPNMAQSVGKAMGENPLPVIVPCHRVLAAGNKMGGFSAPGGTRTKRRMLELEGVRLGPRDPAQLDLAL